MFVDGGVSLANNPAWQLFLVATLEGFRFRWETGEDKLLIVSVGTGRWDEALDRSEVLRSDNLYWARTIPGLFMQDASEMCELMLQYLSDSPTRRSIDYEVGDLEADLLGGRRHLTYLRYDAVLESASLGDALGEEPLPEAEVESLRDLAAGANARRLHQIGQAFAARLVRDGHFPRAFDPGPP